MSGFNQYYRERLDDRLQKIEQLHTIYVEKKHHNMDEF